MKIEAANSKLKAGGVHLKLEDRGGWVSVRGMLPCKDGEGRKQQRISLGIAATPGGIDRAFLLALEIRSAIDCDRFDWGDYCQDDSHDGGNTFGFWIEALGQDYLNRGGKQETWEREYIAKCFNKIPDWGMPLDADLLRGIVMGIPADTRTRSRVVRAFSKLLKFAGRDDCLLDYRGTYSPLNPINPRDLPTDADLLSHWERLGSSPWGNAYGLMLIYGIRNYEVFRLEFSPWPTVFVNKGKTKKERYAFPLLPEWTERLTLPLVLPQCSGDNAALGNRVTHQFKRLEVPFSPYNLRHCWARRAFERGIDTATASVSLGHGEGVHRGIYQHWIGRESWERKFYNALKNDD